MSTVLPFIADSGDALYAGYPGFATKISGTWIIAQFVSGDNYFWTSTDLLTYTYAFGAYPGNMKPAGVYFLGGYYYFPLISGSLQLFRTSSLATIGNLTFVNSWAVSCGGAYKTIVTSNGYFVLPEEDVVYWFSSDGVNYTTVTPNITLHGNDFRYANIGDTIYAFPKGITAYTVSYSFTALNNWTAIQTSWNFGYHYRLVSDSNYIYLITGDTSGTGLLPVEVWRTSNGVAWSKLSATNDYLVKRDGVVVLDGNTIKTLCDDAAGEAIYALSTSSYPAVTKRSL